MSTSVVASAVTPVNWAQSGFSKANTFFNPSETIITPSTEASLHYKWSAVSPVVRAGDFDCARMAAPIIDNGRMFAADTAGFAAYDAVTGAPQWNHHTNFSGGERTDLLSATGTTLLVVSTDCVSEDPSTALTAYNASTGAQLWRSHPSVGTFALLVDGTTAVVAGDSDGIDETTAYRVSDGALLWTVSDLQANPLVSAGGRILLNSSSATKAVNSTTGAALWTSATRYTAVAATFDGNKFLATTTAGNLVCLNAATGSVVWTATGLAGTVAVDSSIVYVSHGTTLSWLSATTGTVTRNVATSTVLGQPTVAGGIVYVPRAGGALLRGAATGAAIDDDNPYQPTDHFVVANGLLYVTSGRIIDVFGP